jgi:hypothetical protein
MGQIIPDTLYTRLLLGTVVFELIIDLVIEVSMAHWLQVMDDADFNQANILWRFNTEVKSASSTPSMLENKRRLPIFLIIFGLAQYVSLRPPCFFADRQPLATRPHHNRHPNQKYNPNLSHHHLQLRLPRLGHHPGIGTAHDSRRSPNVFD